MTEEVWRMSSVDGLMVSSLGRYMLVPSIASMPHGGYRHYETAPRKGVLPNDDPRPIVATKGKAYRLHKLVCEAFNGPKPFDNAVVMHLDGDSTNNCATNLKWGTQKENLNHEKFLEYRRGSNPRERAMPDEMVRYVRNSDKSLVELARETGYAACTISNIRSGRSRASVR